MMKSLKKEKKGFTLVELIIVIAILAILVGLLVPNVIRYIEKSRVSKDKSAFDAMYTAATTAIADEAAYSFLNKDAAAQAPATSVYVGQSVTLKDIMTKTDDFAKEFKATYGTIIYATVSKEFATADAGSNVVLNITANGDGYSVAVVATGTVSGSTTTFTIDSTGGH